MAEDAPEAPPSRSTGKGIGAKLSKKLGPLPVWGWALGVGGLAFLGYRYWKSKQTASSATATGTAVGAGTTGSGAPGDTGGGGYSDAGGDQLQGLLSQLNQQLQTSGAPTGSQQGYSLLTSVGAITAVRNAGQQLYEQLTPGVFTAYNGGIPAAAGIPGQPGATPLYALSNGVAAQQTASSTPAGVSGAAAPTTGSAGGISSGAPSMGPSSPATPAGAVAVTTPAPAQSPITSGGSLGYTSPVSHGPPGPLPASGPLV